MRIEVILTEEQLHELNETKKLTLDISVSDSNVKPELTFTKWPDTRGYKPAERLIDKLNKSSLKPSDLPYLSRQRIARLIKTDNIGKVMTSKTWEKVNQVEKIFGITFPDLKVPSLSVQAKLRYAFMDTIENNEEAAEMFMFYVKKPILRSDSEDYTPDEKYAFEGYKLRDVLLGKFGAYNETDIKSLTDYERRKCIDYLDCKSMSKLMPAFFS